MLQRYSRLYTALGAAEILMKDWHDEDYYELDMVILPPEKVDSLIDKENVNDVESNVFENLDFFLITLYAGLV